MLCIAMRHNYKHSDIRGTKLTGT